MTLTSLIGRLEKASVRFGYRQTMRGNWISDLWSRIWFHWFCPYPIIDDKRARACIASGNCGCSNSMTARDLPTPEPDQ